MKSRHLVALVLAASTVAAACGARLTPAQLRAYDGPSGPGGDSVASAAGSATVLTPAASAGAGGGSSSGAGGQENATRHVVAGAAAPVDPATPTPGLSVSDQVCRGPVAGPGISAGEIDVGNVGTLTGPIPGELVGAEHGMTAFAAYLDSVGGICGRKLVVKAADDNLDASQNATATQSLAGSVFAFVGSFSGVDEGGVSVLQSTGVPDVGQASSNQRFDLANNFSPDPLPVGLDMSPFIYFKQKYPQAVTHMAILIENQPAIMAYGDAEEQALESLGYKFVYTDSNIELTQTDFSADAQAMKAAGAQGLVYYAVGAYYGYVAKAMQNAGLQMPLADYGQNAYDQAFLSTAGSAANGAVLWSNLAMFDGEDGASVPTVTLFDKWYRALYSTTPDELAAWGWMAGMLFVDGLNAGGGLTRAALTNGLKQVTNFDAGGMVAPDNPAGKTPPGCYLIIDVVNQRFVRDPVDPTTGYDCQYAPDYFYAH